MRLSVVFATRANDSALPHVGRILGCLAHQTFQDFEVIVVCDRRFREAEYEDFYEVLCSLLDSERQESILQKTTFCTNLNSDFSPSSLGDSNGSRVRNFGIQQADTELIQLFDEDNWFDEEYLEKAISYHDQQKKQCSEEVVICSSLYYRDTGEIQNQGFSKFCYWQSRPMVHYLEGQRCGEIQMFSGNGLLGNTEIFKSVLYDEQIARIMEDLDFTLSLCEKGVKLFTYADLIVKHYERDKTKLELSWIGFEGQAYQKARNRFLFVGKHGKSWDRIAFYCVGLPGCMVWLSMKAILYGGRGRWKIVRGLMRGCREGWKILGKSG